MPEKEFPRPCCCPVAAAREESAIIHPLDIEHADLLLCTALPPPLCPAREGGKAKRRTTDNGDGAAELAFFMHSRGRAAGGPTDFDQA